MSVCPTLCPTGLNRACRWLQVEEGGPDWGIPRGPKKSALAATGFTRQAVGIRWAAVLSSIAVGATDWS